MRLPGNFRLSPVFCAAVLACGSSLPLHAEVGAVIVDDDAPAPSGGSLQASPREDLFRIANMVYDQAQGQSANPAERQRLLTLAEARYADYIDKFPTEAYTEQAYYRRALCLMELGRLADAQSVFRTIVDRYRKGPFVAASAYRLASMNFQGRNYKSALEYYTLAMQESDKPELKLDARYRIARCYLMMNRKAEAASTFSALASDPAATPVFRNASLVSLAALDVEANRLDSALGIYEKIAVSPGVDSRSLGGALLQGAAVALKLNKPEKAEAFYSSILKDAKLGEFFPEAQVGLMSVYYSQKKYNEVLREMRRNPMAIQPELEGRRALLAGQAAFSLKKYVDAISYFGTVERLSPLSDIAFESAYRRLLCSQEMNLPNMDRTVAAFLDTYGKRFADHPYIHMVRVMQADELSSKNPAEAGKLFRQVDTLKLPASMRADVLYKQAWVLASSNDRVSALKALDEFISQYPSDARLAEALVLRGEMFMQTNDEVGAMSDFNRVIASYPKKEVAATAWQRAAQLYLAKQDTPNMIKYYEGLIGNFPKTKPAAIAEAHYMIGKGYFDMKDYAKAVSHLEEARNLHPAKYQEPANILLVTTFYQLQDAPRLRTAYDRLKRDNRQAAASLPESIPAWLGSQCFALKDYAGADSYLTMASDVQEPQRTKKVIWATLAKARARIGKFERALKAIDFYLDAEKAPGRRAQGLLDKAVILSNMGKNEDARKAAEEALQLGVEGPVKATLNITLGDIAYALGQFDEAARLYGTTASLFTSDRELKPQALYKASVALEKAGKKEEAKQFSDDLQKEFPRWSPRENIFTPTN